MRLIILGQILTTRGFYNIKVLFWKLYRIVNLTHNDLVNGVNLKFRIDTGADVTVVSKDIFKLLDDVNVIPSSKILTGPQCDPLNVEGKFIAKL